MLSIDPVERLSSVVHLVAAREKRLGEMDPTKPAPPVMSTRMAKSEV